MLQTPLSECGLREWDSDLATNYLQASAHSHNAYHTYMSKVTLPEDHLAMYGITSSPMNMAGVTASGLRQTSKWRSHRALIRGSSLMRYI